MRDTFSIMLKMTFGSGEKEPQKSAPSTPEESNSDARIAIVASRYNSDFTDALVKSSTETICIEFPELLKFRWLSKAFAERRRIAQMR